MYDISIITPIYNNSKITEEYIQNVLEYTKSNYQLIIINNGSNDETKDVLLKYSNYDNIEIINNKENYGFGYANNQGINISNSNYICFLNNDVLLFQNWDEHLIKPFKIFNNVGAVGPVTNNCAGIQSENYQFANVKPNEYYKTAIQLSELKHTYLEYHRIIGFCILTKTKLIKEIGGFDEMYNIGNYEDDDLCLRIKLNQLKIIICENVFVYHHGSKTFENNKINQSLSLSKNAKLFSNKWKIQLREDGHYSYVLEKLDNKKIINTNYLSTTKAVKPDLLKLSTPKCATLGNLSNLKLFIASNSSKKIINEFLQLIKLRPFHPEAHLQMVDYYLNINNDKEAVRYIRLLGQLTPNWETAQNLMKKFNVNKKKYHKINKLSICLITKNEEHNISRCLNSLKKIQNKQIVILDTGSTDNTIEIAKKFNAEIYTTNWNNDFSEARNIALKYCTGDWILFLDADEELAPGVLVTLKEDMANPNILGYRLPLENVGTELHGCNYVPRLVRNAPGLHFIGKIHETIHASVLVVMRQWNMDQVMGKTKILHHGYKPEALKKKNKVKRNLALYKEALEELPDEPSIMMNYAHDLNHDGQTDKAYQIYKKILSIFEQHKKEHITPEVREQFMHNYGVFLAQHLKMKELSEVMYTRTARETGPVANVHYMTGLGLMNCSKFREAIPELEASIEKAYDDTLAPCVPDVRTWKLKHLLANCHASVGDELKAIRLWEEVIAECDDSTDPYHDYARFLSTLERNKEALEILLKGLKVQGDTRKIWELGCGVVNKDPELAEMSLEWTEEALKHHPDSDVTNVRRGESLMKNGRFSEAVEYFSRLSDRGDKTATAAQLVCRQLSDQAEEHDPEIARGFVNEVTGWIDVLDKAPCAFDRELAEQLIR